MFRSLRRLRVPVGIAALTLLSACVPISSFFFWNVPWDGGANHTLTYQTFRIGPYNLAPMNEPGWEVIGNQAMPKPAGNVAIHSTDFTIVDAAGNTVGLDRVHLHHIVMMDESVRDPLCPTVGARFTGTGSERTKLELNGDYAYRSDATDVWTSTFHIHTTSANPAPGVYLQYVVGYDPITPDTNHRFTTPYFFDVTGCWENSASLYDVPGGGGTASVHTPTKTYTAQRSGTAVFAGGHIHAGGLNISLTRDATGETYCNDTASYAPGGHPNHPRLGQLQRVSSCQLHARVNAGETFTLRSRYDNEYPVLKAMGIMLAHIWHPPGS